MLHEWLDKIDTRLVCYFGNKLEFRSLEFFLAWGKATTRPRTGKLLKRLFTWFCHYYAGFVIPQDGSVPAGTVIMPYENILEFIERAEVASVLPCGCRTMRPPKDKSVPRATCMQFTEPKVRVLDDVVKDSLHKAKWTTPEKILDILKECEGKGLVHQIMCFSNPQGRKTYVLCNCDNKSCIPNYIHNTYGVPFVRSSGFLCKIDAPDACSHCGLCSKRCIYSAALFKDGLPVVDEEKCMGCGVCVPACEAKIRRMVREPREEIHRITKEYLDKNLAEALVAKGVHEKPAKPN